VEEGGIRSVTRGFDGPATAPRKKKKKEKYYAKGGEVRSPHHPKGKNPPGSSKVDRKDGEGRRKDKPICFTRHVPVPESTAQRKSSQERGKRSKKKRIPVIGPQPRCLSPTSEHPAPTKKK